METEEVQAASESLRLAISAHVSNRRKRLLKLHGGGFPSADAERHFDKRASEAQKAVRHASLVLRELTSKRHALEIGADALQTCSDECARELGCVLGLGEANSTAKRGVVTCALRAGLSSWFTSYLRLRDGMVLLQSGECRHPGDAERARSTAMTDFSSRFRESATVRGDGYTKMYSSGMGYSGLGWDEFYDENLGIRRRLLDLLISLGLGTDKKWTSGAREKLWERLCERGAEAFESALDRHDSELQVIKGKIESTRLTFVAAINAALHKLRQDVSSEICGGKLTMTTEDKFEKIELHGGKSLGITELRITRRANEFRIQDKGGVLPSGWSRQKWVKAMQTPPLFVGKAQTANRGGTNSHKKDNKDEEKIKGRGSDKVVVEEMALRKRRIIEDDSDSSSSEENEEAPTKKNKKMMSMHNSSSKVGFRKRGAVADRDEEGAVTDLCNSGLQVQVKAKLSQVTTDASVAEIKRSLGVDAACLEGGREGLEAEELISSATACVDEAKAAGLGQDISQAVQPSSHKLVAHDLTELDELVSRITEGRDDVRRYRAVCEKSAKGNSEDLWNDREFLRESMMTLGNDLLSLHREIIGDGASSQQFKDASNLKEAETLFQDSLDTVKAQEVAFRRLSQNMSPHEISATRRNLLLLRGRALTNVGVARIELALINSHQHQRIVSADGKTLLSGAIRTLDAAGECARAMRSHAATQTTQTDRFKVAAHIDLLSAIELEALSARWHGVALWYLGRRKQCVDKLEVAAGSGEGAVTDISSTDSEVVEATLNVFLEYYASAVYLIDLAVRVTERTPVQHRKLVEKGDMSLFGGDELVKCACKGYQLAMRSSNLILKCCQTSSSLSYSDIREQNGVRSSSELSKEENKIKDWWQGRKDAQKDSMQVSCPLTPMHRTDICQNGSMLHSKAPTKRIVLGKTFSRNNGRQECGTLRTDGNLGHIRHKGKEHNIMDQFDALALPQDNLSPTSEPPSQWGGGQMTTFRKWGDELLSQVSCEDASTGTSYVYPTVLPENPPQW